MQSLLQMGQKLGLGPPTRDWCCKESHMFQLIKERKDIPIFSAHLANVAPETSFCGKTLSTDVAVEPLVLQPLNLRLVVSEVLL